MTARQALEWARSTDVTLQITYLRTLLSSVTGMPYHFLFSHGDFSLSFEQIATFKEQVARLKSGEPLSRLVGKREFWGLDFSINEDTLDPRADSETLIEAVLKQYPNRQTPLQILDLGTGTGCLLISLLSEYPEAQGLGIDQSQKALEAAQANAEKLLHGSHRAVFCVSNWYDHVVGGFDVIISNPPYVTEEEYAHLDSSVRLFDPKAALVGGKDGLEPYRSIIDGAPAFLKEKGILVLEIGFGQKGSVSALLQRRGFRLLDIRNDLSGIERCLVSAYDGLDFSEGEP